MKNFEKILKALANYRRLQALKFIKINKRASVTNISEHLHLSFKSTSKHLAVLLGANIVEKEQKDLTMFYSIAVPLPKMAKNVLDLI